jgi:AraC-like DNA-binding protein
MKISEIAECVGYNSADHFSRIFRSEYQMSPQEYRKKHQSAEDLFQPMAQVN